MRLTGRSTPTMNDSSRISDTEYNEYRAYKDAKIRDAAIAEGRQQASSEHQAEDAAANADALKRLTDKGLSLRDAFGNSSTTRGRDFLVNVHRSSVGNRSQTYARLRRQAVAQGLVQ
jgi:hypothetical protein